MKRNSIIIIGSVIGAGLLGFFLYRQFRKKKMDKANVPDKPRKRGSVVVDQLDSLTQDQYDALISQKPSAASGGTAFGGAFNVASNIFGTLTNWADYEVVTQTMPLNVRENPDGKSRIVASLAKGSTIKGKASGVKGWFEVSKDGQTTLGYVSSQFLKFKKP